MTSSDVGPNLSVLHFCHSCNFLIYQLDSAVLPIVLAQGKKCIEYYAKEQTMTFGSNSQDLLQTGPEVYELPREKTQPVHRG